jgi:hypothetical protein
MQVAGVEAAGREHDALLFDLGSESQTRIDIRQAGEHPCNGAISGTLLSQPQGMLAVYCMPPLLTL